MTENKCLKIEDLDRLILVSDPKISPNEKYTAFTVTKPSVKENKYLSNIWILDVNSLGYEQLTNGQCDHSPNWSPDSRKVCFMSRRTFKEDEIGAELWILNVERRYEPRLLLKLDKPVSNVEWSPKGDKILFISHVGETDKDVKIIEDIPIWFNGEGFIYNIRTHLFIIDIEPGNYTQVTSGDFNVKLARWSPNGAKIAYLVSEDRRRPYIINIYILDLEREEKIKLTEDNMTILDLAWSPNGRKIAFKGHDLKRGLSTHRKIWLIDIDTKNIELLTDIDKDLINAINSDIRGPSSSHSIQWIDTHIYFHVSDGGYVHLYRVDIDGKIEPVIKQKATVEDFSVSKNFICLTLMTSTKPLELYLYKNGGLNKITKFNQSLLEKVKLNKPEYFKFKASDGVKIDGWILRPYKFEEDKKYPAILYVHGGPPTTYGESFIHEFHVLSGEGFVVIYTNPRGSTGYSEDFKDIRGEYGKRDYKDLVEAVDYVIKKYKFIDKNRLGITGGSYGGFMTNWIIGHTDKFKAAVTQRSICNWISDYGTTDIGFYFNEDQIAGGFNRPFWDERWFNKYWDQSPLKYVGNIKTPTLIIHSVEDYRCWMDQALQLFTALKMRGVPTRLVLFPKENHDLSRKGKPKHRIERLKQIVYWFKKYLVETEKLA